MDIEQFREYCISLGEATEKTPFGKILCRAKRQADYNSISTVKYPTLKSQASSSNHVRKEALDTLLSEFRVYLKDDKDVSEFLNNIVAPTINRLLRNEATAK